MAEIPPDHSDERAADIKTLAADPGAAMMPELPAYVEINPADAMETGEYLDLYISYSSSISPMTPRIFHESAGLFLASVAIARRLRINMGYGDVFPNLFILWLAPTTLYRKTTALKVARSISRTCYAHLMAPEDTTPEALIWDMSGQQPRNFDKYTIAEQEEWKAGRNFAGQHGWILDEMSGLLNGAGKDYNQGLIESILHLNDCDEHFTRSTMGSGRVTVKNSYLSLLGASTPTAMFNHMTMPHLWGNGWWPRFAILTPDERPNWCTPEPPENNTEIIKPLNELYKRLKYGAWPNPHPVIDVKIDPTAHDLWNDYNRAVSFDLLQDDLDGRLYGTYGRLPEQALKIAMILAALDWPENTPAPEISLPQITRALLIVETWRDSAHRGIEMTTQSEAHDFYDRITRIIARLEPGGASGRDIFRLMRDKTPSQIELAAYEMVELGILTSEESQGRGRPTVKYHLVKDE